MKFLDQGQSRVFLIIELLREEQHIHSPGARNDYDAVRVGNNNVLG